MLSLTAGQVREGSESGAGLPRGLCRCCPHPLGAGFLGSTASPLILPVTSQGALFLSGSRKRCSLHIVAVWLFLFLISPFLSHLGLSWGWALGLHLVSVTDYKSCPFSRPQFSI